MYIRGYSIILGPLCPHTGVANVIIDRSSSGAVRFSRADGHGRWFCQACCYSTTKKEVLLQHVLECHYVPPRPAYSNEPCQSVYKLAGVHVDPTYDEVVYRLTGCRS